jgi:hypothetical protein
MLLAFLPRVNSICQWVWRVSGVESASPTFARISKRSATTDYVNLGVFSFSSMRSATAGTQPVTINMPEVEMLFYFPTIGE